MNKYVVYWGINVDETPVDITLSELDHALDLIEHPEWDCGMDFAVGEILTPFCT